MSKIHIRLPKETIKVLDELAIRLSNSRSGIARMLLNESLERYTDNPQSFFTISGSLSKHNKLQIDPIIINQD